uniref:CNH domain-containing protein n=1 Tax=Romanomermis culicivorax TaxID=13658 RepID=A0A915L687_ROMCU
MQINNSIDPVKGIGTAYEGVVRVPKPGGVKKGWQPQYVVVCDFKLFLYDCTLDRAGKPAEISPSVSNVLDMKDDEFSVTSVQDSDVIHANKRDVPCIFRLATSQIHRTSSDIDPSYYGSQSSSTSDPAKCYTLLMVDNVNEKNKWVIALNELHRLLRKNNKFPQRKAFELKELLDNQSLPLIRGALSAAVIDKDRIALATEEGLFCIELDREIVVRVGDNKRVEMVEYVAAEQLLIVLAGKEKQLKLIPVSALDGRELKWIKMEGTKQCHTFCFGSVNQATSNYICVAVKKMVIVYEINRTTLRHKKLKELAMPGLPQCLSILNGRLCVGYPSGFRMWSFHDNAQQPLLNLEDSSLQFINNATYDAHFLIETSPDKEYLLIFQKFGLYVDSYGKRSRSHELMFPTLPLHFAYSAPYLSVFCQSHVDVFNVSTAEWVQTLNIKMAKPLTKDGSLSLCYISESPFVVVLNDLLSDENVINIPLLQTNVKGPAARLQPARKKRKYSFKILKDEDRNARPNSMRRVSYPEY